MYGGVMEYCKRRLHLINQDRRKVQKFGKDARAAAWKKLKAFRKKLDSEPDLAYEFTSDIAFPRSQR